jgi:hypothetical protein
MSDRKTFLTRIRFYVVQVLPTLFGEWAVLREWGRRGSQAATAIRDRFRKWWGRYEATCARLGEAMRAIDTAIRDRFRKWQAKHQAVRERLDEQGGQPPNYSLISMQRATVVAKWLAGMSGGATVLAFAFYIQSFLSILSIKGDCVSRAFVAEANKGAVFFARIYLVSGMLALVAIALPPAVGIGRNFLRWTKNYELPRLQLGHEFDGWSERQVIDRVALWQSLLVWLCVFVFFGVTLSLAFLWEIATTPERVLEEWHYLETKCPLPPYQGAS